MPTPTVYCYDRYAQHKRVALLLAAAMAALLLSLTLLLPAKAQPQQLPRVLISGKSQADRVVHQLPRVVIEGRRVDGQRYAESPGELRTN